MNADEEDAAHAARAPSPSRRSRARAGRRARRAPLRGTAPQVDPERVQSPDDEGRAERAGRVHRRAGDRAAEHRVEADGPADRDRRRLADGARVGGDGHDHEHQEERSGRSPRGTTGRRSRTAASRRRGRRCRARPAGGARPRARRDLRGPVERRHASTGSDGRARTRTDRRVEVRAGDMADRVDHRHDHEPEGDRDAEAAERVRLRVDHDRAAAREDECERAEGLGDEPAGGGGKSPPEPAATEPRDSPIRRVRRRASEVREASALLPLEQPGSVSCFRWYETVGCLRPSGSGSRTRRPPRRPLREHVDDPHPVPVGKRLEQRLELDRLRVRQRGPRAAHSRRRAAGPCSSADHIERSR